MRSALYLLLFATVPAIAGEYALLSSGGRLHADRHEVAGGMVRLFDQERVTEIPAGIVLGFEKAEDPPPVAQPEPPAPEIARPTEAKPPVSEAPKPATADPKSLLRAAADRTGLPPQFETLVQSVAKVESGFQVNAISPKGAIGVMQLMPDTARQLGADPHDPEQNIDAGARLLRDLLEKYNGDVVKALAAYNAGEAAVDRYQGIPPYPETQHYVNQVVKDYIRNGGPPGTTAGK